MESPLIVIEPMREWSRGGGEGVELVRTISLKDSKTSRSCFKPSMKPEYSATLFVMPVLVLPRNVEVVPISMSRSSELSSREVEGVLGT